MHTLGVLSSWSFNTGRGSWPTKCSTPSALESSSTASGFSCKACSRRWSIKRDQASQTVFSLHSSTRCPLQGRAQSQWCNKWKDTICLTSSENIIELLSIALKLQWSDPKGLWAVTNLKHIFSLWVSFKLNCLVRIFQTSIKNIQDEGKAIALVVETFTKKAAVRLRKAAPINQSIGD